MNTQPLPCMQAPAGWLCTRNSGHTGPCAAWPLRPPWPVRLRRGACAVCGISYYGHSGSHLVIGIAAHAYREPTRRAVLADWWRRSRFGWLRIKPVGDGQAPGWHGGERNHP